MARFQAVLISSVLALAAVATAMPVRAQELAVIVNRIVYPGETIEPGAAEQVPYRPTRRFTAPFAREIGQVEGKVSRRTILPGKLIPISSLREPFAVEAGSLVTVIYNHGGLTISARAVPLQPGAVGDMVRMRNPDSGRVFTGVVMADGTVRVSG